MTQKRETSVMKCGESLWVFSARRRRSDSRRRRWRYGLRRVKKSARGGELLGALPNSSTICWNGITPSIFQLVKKIWNVGAGTDPQSSKGIRYIARCWGRSFWGVHQSLGWCLESQLNAGEAGSSGAKVYGQVAKDWANTVVGLGEFGGYPLVI